MYSGDVVYSKMTSQPLYRDNQIDPDLEHKSKKVSDKFSEVVNLVSNEPSVAFFRIQEHVRKTLPQLVDTKHEVEEMQTKVQGACFDAEYATNAVKTMQSSAIHFQNIQDLMKNAMFMKQQISYEDTRRRQGRVSPGKGAPASADRKSKIDLKPEETEARAQPPSENNSSQVRRLPVQKDTVSSEDSAENREVEHFMARSPSPSKK